MAPASFDAPARLSRVAARSASELVHGKKSQRSRAMRAISRELGSRPSSCEGLACSTDILLHTCPYHLVVQDCAGIIPSDGEGKHRDAGCHRNLN